MLNRIQLWWSWTTSRSPTSASFWDVVRWWERRRLSYNIFLATLGVPSLCVFFIAVAAARGLQPGEDAIEPLALMVAPVLANIAYTAGWFVEGGLRYLRPADAYGPRLMRIGLGFSGLVLLLPPMYWTVVAVARRF